jgi:acyl carrier protein
MWWKQQAVPTAAEIAQEVAKVLIDVLGMDEEDIQPAARLTADLNAESIDFIDIVFRLERAFGITIRRNELFPDSIFGGNPECIQDGRITARGLAELHTRLPFVGPDDIPGDLEVDRLDELFTVGLITRYIQYRLGAGSGMAQSA